MPLPERDQEPSSVDTYESSLPAKQTRLEHAARKLDMQMETVRNLIGMHASSRRQIGQLLPEVVSVPEARVSLLFLVIGYRRHVTLDR